jgi:hypothetical protein
MELYQIVKKQQMDKERRLRNLKKKKLEMF